MLSIFVGRQQKKGRREGKRKSHKERIEGRKEQRKGYGRKKSQINGTAREIALLKYTHTYTHRKIKGRVQLTQFLTILEPGRVLVCLYIIYLPLVFLLHSRTSLHKHAEIFEKNYKK